MAHGQPIPTWKLPRLKTRKLQLRPGLQTLNALTQTWQQRKEKQKIQACSPTETPLNPSDASSTLEKRSGGALEAG